MINKLIAAGIIGLFSTSLFATTLIYNFDEPLLTKTWTSYDISLDESSGWLIQESGLAPTSQQMLDILSDLTLFEISMDREAQFFLDNVDFAGLAQSTFSECTTDGWTITGTNSMGCNSIIGSPPGSINNGGLPADFLAPEKFIGDMSASYGSNLTFDLWRNSFSTNNLSTGSITFITSVPEPGALWLFASGILGVLIIRRKSIKIDS
jgi:hypothetical protein